mmetsp:Transcript_690/g.1244  ORF Transcript_690/g.1244 Transcript_690/m.1244 type:complete len:110 (-) Transcript_690:4791-5120(-)
MVEIIMGGWEQPLLGCLSDIGSCLVVLFCPGGYCYCQATSVSKATGEGCCIPYFCPIVLCCIGAAINRSKIRDRYLIDGGFCTDCITHLFCGPCAVCQEYREANHRENS